jgi:hypothetical protein
MNVIEQEEEGHDKRARDFANEYGNDENEDNGNDNNEDDDLKYEVGGGKGAPVGKHKHQHDVTQDEVKDRTYNLPARAPAQLRFNHAIDEPHCGKLYFPPTQLTQKGKQLNPQGIVDTIRYIYGRIMTQMTAKAGIKRFRQAAMAAHMQEFAQLENLDVYEAVNSRLLTRKQRRAAPRVINLIKQKRDGKLKGRTVADGSVQ